MKKIFFFTLFASISFQLYSQEKERVYVDENYQKIDFQKFTKKLQSNLFYVAKVENDTALFKKLRFKQYFGNIGLKKKYQLNKLFYKRYQIDTTKTWLIHYLDSLPDIAKMPVESGVIFLDSMGNQDGKMLSETQYKNSLVRKSGNAIYLNTQINNKRHMHIISFSDYKKIIPNEKRKYKKVKDVDLLHFYNYDKGYLKNDINNNLYKDHNLILKRTFTDGMRMYNTIILFANGDFCLNPNGKVKKLLKPVKFKKEEKKWIKKLKNSSNP